MSCYRESSKCQGKRTSWRIWREGDTEAVEVVACQVHSKALAELYRVGDVVGLPPRPRISLEATQLKTIPSTAHLKLPERKKPPRDRSR